MDHSHVPLEMTTIGTFPGFTPNDSNPYLFLFYTALRKHGVEWWGQCDPIESEAKGEWPDIIHLHWPELLWKERHPRWAAKLRRVPGGWRLHEALRPRLEHQRMTQIMAALRASKARGTKILWTLHNVEPHENASNADRLGYEKLATLTDLCIFHSRSARESFHGTYPGSASSVLIPHGNYAGVYPPPRPREEVLQEIGLDPSRPAVCCVGNLREYKGVDLAIEAIRAIGDGVQLIVAGKPHSTFDSQGLLEKVEGLKQVALLPRFVGNQMFSDLTSASDATLLPYLHVTSSGVLLASLTLGTGVIASDLPYFREILLSSPASAGKLFETGNANALADATVEYLSTPRESRRAAALDLSDAYEWERLVSPLVAWLGK